MTLLRLGRVDRIRIQVGYREEPEGPVYDAFLLDLPVPDPEEPRDPPFDTATCLATLDPVLYVGSEIPRHYSLHEHRWHTSWAPTAGTVDLGLTVTTGPSTPADSDAAYDAVVGCFRELLDHVNATGPETVARDAALLKARRGVASAYGLDAESLSLVSSEFHAGSGTWRFGFRTPTLERYAVAVGFVDGHPGSLRARREPRDEVMDSVGPA